MTEEGNNTINDTINNTLNDVNNTPIIENNNNKSIKTKFEKSCNHCNKILKSAKTYAHHINNQLCYSKNEITYCKICNITMDTHANYIKHLLTIEHLNSIGCNKLETLNTNQPSTILQADPYLSNNEARNIGTNNLGNKFTFVFQNNQTQIVDLIPPKQDNKIQSNATMNSTMHAPVRTTSMNILRNNILRNIEHNNIEHNNVEHNNVFSSIPEPTDKQKKILLILEKIGTEEEGRTLLVKMLEKLHIEDYRGLQSFIKCNNNISKELKNVYLDIMDKFITMLVKRRNNGETIYKDKDISKLVISLTI